MKAVKPSVITLAYSIQTLSIAVAQVPRGKVRAGVLQALALYANDRSRAIPLSLKRGVEVDGPDLESLGRVDAKHVSAKFFHSLFGADGLSGPLSKVNRVIFVG